MLLGLMIDIDHVFATPMYDPNRCSMGFHPLHGLGPVIIYIAALVHPKTRVLGIGLCVHVLLDSMDCYVTNGVLVSSAFFEGIY